MDDFLESATLFFFLLGVALTVTHPLWANDVWWHLKTGEWIFHHRAVPRIDLYSHTVSDHPWIDLSWGFQLLIFIFYKISGVNGIIFFKVAVVTLTFFLLFRFFYRKISLLFLLPLLYGTLLAAHERLVERPEVLSYLFLVLYLLVMEKDREKPTRLIYALPLFHLLWVNSHALFVLGLFVILSYCLGELLSASALLKRHSVILMLSCLATFVNPYGLQGALFPLTLFGRISGELKIFTYGIFEFMRPLAQHDSSLTIFLYKVLLVGGLFSFLLNHKRFPPAHGILFLAFAYLSLLARRNIAPFSFVVSFLILKNLSDLPFFKKHPPRVPVVSGSLLALTLLFPLPFITHTFYEREESFFKRFGLGISEYRYCIGAAEFIEKNRLPGNFFNSGLEVGDYLIWRLSPHRKVFMDGRLEVYGELFFQELFQLFAAPSLWPKWAEKYQINFCILDHTNRKHEGLLRWIYDSPGWSPVYLDEKVVIFMKNAPENRDILERHAIDLAHDPVPPHREEWAVEVGLADFYGKMGLLNRSEALYKKALRVSSKSAIPHYNLGIPYAKKGLEDAAIKEFKESLKRMPQFGETHYQLGMLYTKKGLFSEAEKEYLRVSVSDPVYLPARNALGILHAEKGEFEKAEKEFRNVLKHNPDALETRENLKKLEQLKNNPRKAL